MPMAIMSLYKALVGPLISLTSLLPHVSRADDHLSPPELPFSHAARSAPNYYFAGEVSAKAAESVAKSTRKVRFFTVSSTMLPGRHPARRADTTGTGSLVSAATRAAVAEFVATAIFVFAAEGSVYSLWKLYTETGTAGGLLAVAIAHALALAAAVAVAINASGGHVNPAVTFGVLVGRRISFGRAAVYWAAQLLGAVAAALLLRIVSGSTRPMGFGLGHGIHERHALLLEAVMTFGLTYTAYATAVDRSRGSAIAPLAIGFVLGANILAGGPFDGAAMNPARAFGPALVGWSWRHHWVYWVGPLIGAGLAGALYEFVATEQQQPEELGATAAAPRMPLASEDY